MPWPTPQDYNEAIQNPQSNFDDPELKAGTPELTPLGLPRPITGGFASVYRMRCGQRDWAVRCFLREYADQQKRYAAISQHLAAVKLPYTVGFEFLPRGIRIRGQWYPILKMEWVQGEPLNTYIETHLNDPSALSHLAHRWAAMMQALQQARIAHGDLQHGNVLVANGSLKLIDYDGMFVPALAGQASHEVGHRNYQHPQRDETDFGPYLDHFSAWVIYLSLVALSVEPGLWAQVGAGDEHLLFRKEDFERPQASAIFSLLTRQGDPRLQALAAQFQSLLCIPPEDIPPLEGPPTPQRPPARRSFPALAWLQGAAHQTQTGGSLPAASSQSVVPAAGPAANPAWVADFISQPDIRKAFRLSPNVPRLLAALSLAACVLIAFCFPHAFPLVGSLGLALLLNTVALYLFYELEPAIAGRRTLLARRRAVCRAIAAIDRALQEIERQQERLRVESSDRRDALLGLKLDLEEKEKRELARVLATLKQARDSLQARRKQLQRQEAEALEAVRARFEPKIEALNARLEALERARVEEIGRRLASRQEAFVADHLRRQRIWKSSISGIGRGFKLRLLANGLGSAADITEERLQRARGIGERRANALRAWRLTQETKARSAMPTALHPAEMSRIEARYGWRKRRLERRRDAEQARLSAAEDAIQARVQKQQQALNAEQDAAQSRAARKDKEIEARYVQEKDRATQALAQLNAETSDARRRLEEKAEQTRKALPGQHWQLTEIDRELETYHNLTFGRYLRSVFWKRGD